MIWPKSCSDISGARKDKRKQFLEANSQGYKAARQRSLKFIHKMSSSTLIELLGHITFSFTRSVTEHYNPEEPEFTAEHFGYNPLESTGREWYSQPVDELIYQEYSDREATCLDYLTSRYLHVRVIDACTPDENEETPEDQQDEDRAMAWKRFRPSVVRTVCKSMYIGTQISLLTACFIGTVYIMISFLCYKIEHNCEFQPKQFIPVQVQWTRTISAVIACAFLYLWYFANMLLLFRPFQLTGVKRQLIFVCLLTYSLDSLYRVALQTFGTSASFISGFQKIPLNVLFLVSVSWQVYFVTNHFCIRSRREKLMFFLQLIVPGSVVFFIYITVASFIYPEYNNQNKERKLVIALFAPLIGVVVKVISRICVQRLYNVTHPAYSYVLLLPLYFGTAVMFRVLQAELDSLQSIAILGIIHGAAEVIERSTMVVIDHICHTLWKRQSAPWGSFRTPRRERLMADVAIMSMWSESTAIVAVNGFLYLYQFVYLPDKSFLNLLQSFAIYTSVQLVIEWFFASVSLAIETRYQNMAVMAVWRRRWKRHILAAIVNAVPLAMWTSTNLLVIVHGRFHEANKPCKMPFS